MRCVPILLLVLTACGGGAKAIPAALLDSSAVDAPLDVTPAPELCLFDHPCATPGSQCLQSCSCGVSQCTCFKGHWDGCEGCAFNCPDVPKLDANNDVSDAPAPGEFGPGCATGLPCTGSWAVPGCPILQSCCKTWYYGKGCLCQADGTMLCMETDAGSEVCDICNVGLDVSQTSDDVDVPSPVDAADAVSGT